MDKKDLMVDRVVEVKDDLSGVSYHGNLPPGTPSYPLSVEVGGGGVRYVGRYGQVGSFTSTLPPPHLHL